MIRGLAAAIGLLALLMPVLAHAQTNLDRGKSASQIFSSACAECHKAGHSIGKGKSLSALADFLSEHYTTNREQAVALANYVFSGRDSGGTASPKQKPAGASPDDAKTDKREGQKPKPDQGTTANARPDSRVRDEPATVPSMVNPIARPEPTRTERPARNRRKEPATTEPPEPAETAREPSPAPVAAEPPAARPETPRMEPPPAPAPAPTAAAPAEAPGESGAAVPRDNVPD